jgi:response regulator NasT
MRVWLLQGKPVESPCVLETRLHQWLDRAGQRDWAITVLTADSDLPAAVAAGRPDVIVLPANCPAPAGLEEVLQQGVALVVASGTRCEAFLSLGYQYPVHLMPDDPDPACLGFILINARSNLRRLHHWQAQVVELQNRLGDRIVIERAKGVLVQRLGISEDQAYKRLRLLSRRQRRQIRDVAQGVLDADELLQPDLAADEPEAEHRAHKPHQPAPSVTSFGGPLGGRA